ncbi:MAG TPA: sulfite exporter TauE/SafE family protein [Gammaproteobacteria bacterium]|nr:sulfite exporter TauE/SafE family protein [Gammaproteobacteria bacterium]
MDFAFTLAGFTVGFIVGMTGVGGGSLMTPLLVLVFGLKPAVAVGTDLLYAAITKCGGIFVHNKKGSIEWRIVGLLSLGSIPSSILAVYLLKYMDKAGIDYSNLITSSLSIALILTSVVLLFKVPLQKLGQNERFDAIRTLHRQLQLPMTLAAGILLGFLVTLSSVGAGALGAAILFFLYPRLPSIRIVGTDLAHAVPLTAVAGLGHLHLGTIDFSILLSLLVGSLPGIYIGSHVANHLPEKIMRPALASMLLLIGVRLAI